MTEKIEDVEARFTRRCAEDFIFYAKNCLKIRPKTGAPAPLKLWRCQQFLHDAIEDQLKRTGRVRKIVLKPRQIGISTYLAGRNYYKTTHNIGFRTFILAHLDDATDNLFNMAKRFHENTPEIVRPTTGASNAKELVFPKMDSGYVVATAGNKTVGRSHTIQVFHGCLSPDTPVICGSSAKLRPMGEFEIGDLVRTHTGDIAPVSAISRQSKPAFSVTMKTMAPFPLVATGEHRFYTAAGWKELSDLAVGDKLLFPVSKITKGRISWIFRRPSPKRPQGGGLQTSGPDHVEPGYDLGRILGLYLADGCITKQYSNGEPSAVTFAVHEREVERTIAWLEKFPGLYTSIKTQPRQDSKTVSVVAYGKSFGAFVLSLCGELDGKRLPPRWAECGQEFCRGLVHGYLSGDGHSSKREYDRRITAPSIRSAITVGMRDVLASLGYGWAAIAYHPARLRYGKPCKPIYYLRLSGAGVDRLCDELGWQMPPRRRTGAYGEVELRDGYAHVPILDIEDVGTVEVMDFEVGHSDHSYCTVHAATHNSEVAYWPNAEEHAAGIMQAVANVPGSEVILESTANGLSNAFHSLWKAAEKGKGDFEPVFIPWYWHEEYERNPPKDWRAPKFWDEYSAAYKLTPRQLYWAYLKNSELAGMVGGTEEEACWLFKREYPANASEAFTSSGDDNFINPEKVLKARKNEVSGYGPIILGIDPARGGKDKTGIIDRRGRALGTFICKRLDFGEDLMPVAGEVVRIVKDMRARSLPLKKVVIDTTGLGAGLYDRLKEMLGEDLIEGVNFSEKALNSDAYANRRAEMWDRMREWFEDKAGVQVPDTDDFQSDVCAPIRGGSSATHFKSNGQLVLEAKDNIKKRLGYSPDMGDAAALTFAIDFDQLNEADTKWNVDTVKSHGGLGWMM